MIVKVGETKESTFRDCTIDGILVNVYMRNDTANDAIVFSDFLPQSVLLKVILYRNKKEITVVQNNLKILGTYCTLKKGFTNWYRGNIITYPAVGVFSDKVILAKIDFGGCINVKEDDELYIEMTCGANAFTTRMNTGVSYVEFNPDFAIGYEKFTPMIKSKVVQAQENSQKFSIGDNCVKLAYLNFDLDNFSSQAIVTASIQSTQWQASLNFFDLMNRHYNVIQCANTQYRYGNTQPVTAGNEAFPYLPVYPQSVIIHEGVLDVTDLDNLQVDLSLNGPNIAASQNYVVSTTGISSMQLLDRAEKREQKHLIEKVSSLPAKM